MLIRFYSLYPYYIPMQRDYSLDFRLMEEATREQ